MSASALEDRRIRHGFTEVDARRLMEAGAGPAESHRYAVRTNDRKVVMLPSGAGFFTLDRTQGVGRDLVVTEYELPPQTSVHPAEDSDIVLFLDREALVARALTDWEYTSAPSAHPEPVFEVSLGVRLAETPQTVKAGSEIMVMALRGNTPVSITFEAR